MTLHSTTSTRPIPLPAGTLPCAACGVATRDHGQKRITVAAYARAGDPPLAPRTEPLHEFEFVLCPECTMREQFGERVLKAHPQIAYRLGTARDHLVGAALTALAALHDSPTGLPDDDAALLLTDDEVLLSSLLRNVAPLGSAVMFSARFGPLLDAGLRPGTANPRAWAHVTPEDRDQIAAAWADVLADKVAVVSGDVAISPPAPVPFGAGVVGLAGACLLCGVSEVRVSASQMREWGGPNAARSVLWRPTTAPVSVLGGRSGRVSGHLCPACSDAMQHAGGIGPTAMERSLSKTLEPTDPAKARQVRDDGVEGLVAWAVLGLLGIPANDRPWQHVAWADGISTSREVHGVQEVRGDAS